MSSAVWKHFDPPENKMGNFKAKCTHCSRDYSCSKTATSNLIKHLKVSTIYIDTIQYKSACMIFNLDCCTLTIICLVGFNSHN